MDNILFQRIQNLCSEHRITINKLESELGFAPSTIQKWKTSASPSVQKVKSVATYFHVSLDYLIGISNLKDTAEQILKDKKIIQLQCARQKMSEHGRAWADEMLGTFLDGYFRNKDHQL